MADGEAGSGGLGEGNATAVGGWGAELLECLWDGDLVGNGPEIGSGEAGGFGAFWGSALIGTLSEAQLRDTYYSLGAALGAALSITLAISIQKMAIERTLAKPPPLKGNYICPSPIWMFGLFLHMIGGLFEVCALTLAPPQLVVAVGVTGLMWGFAFSMCMHKGAAAPRQSCCSADFWLIFTATWLVVLAAVGVVVSISDVAVVRHWSQDWVHSAPLVTARWQLIDPWPVLIPILVTTALANMGCIIFDLKLQKQRRRQQMISRASRSRKSTAGTPRQAEVAAALGSVSKCNVRLIRFLYPFAAGLNAAWCVFFAAIYTGLMYPTLVDPSERTNARAWQSYIFGLAGFVLLPLQMLWISRALVYFEAWHVLPAFYIALLVTVTSTVSTFFDDFSCIGLYSQRTGIGAGSLVLLLIAEILLFCVSTSKRHSPVVAPSQSSHMTATEKLESVSAAPMQVDPAMDAFDQADVNRSGYLDEGEFAAAYTASKDMAGSPSGTSATNAAAPMLRPEPAEELSNAMVQYESNRQPPPLPPTPAFPGRGPVLPPIGGQIMPYVPTSSYDEMLTQQVHRQTMMLDRVARDVAALREDKMLEIQAAAGDRRSLYAPSTLPALDPTQQALGYSGHHGSTGGWGSTPTSQAYSERMQLSAGQVVIINDQPYMIVEENADQSNQQQLS
mmetsp:Transcript_12969/g.35580  ORF Transcript_12969/g.35580 Transcript_12969/m.35580 type:complete len:675 (-) Transcript_12969:231-2255(-)